MNEPMNELPLPASAFPPTPGTSLALEWVAEGNHPYPAQVLTPLE